MRPDEIKTLLLLAHTGKSSIRGLAKAYYPENIEVARQGLSRDLVKLERQGHVKHITRRNAKIYEPTLKGWLYVYKLLSDAWSKDFAAHYLLFGLEKVVELPGLTRFIHGFCDHEVWQKDLVWKYMHYKLRDIDEKARRLYAEDIDKYDEYVSEKAEEYFIEHSYRDTPGGLKTDKLLEILSDTEFIAYYLDWLIDEIEDFYREGKSDEAEMYAKLGAELDKLGKSPKEVIELIITEYLHERLAPLYDLDRILLTPFFNDTEYDEEKEMQKIPSKTRLFLKEILKGLIKKYSNAIRHLSMILSIIEKNASK